MKYAWVASYFNSVSAEYPAAQVQPIELARLPPRVDRNALQSSEESSR
jgi:hypothetical protein